MKKLCIAFLLIVSIVTLVGCNKDEEEAGGLVTVKMSLKNSINENDGWFAMIAAANQLLEAENIKIEPEIIKTDSWDEYYTKVTTNIVGKTGGTIGRIAESHIPKMIQKKQLQDLTSVYNSLDMSKYNAEAFESVAKKDGKYYGLPTGVQHMVLYYNKRIFDEYNASHPEDQIAYPSSDWENPSTFAEIKTLAEKLSSGNTPNRNYGLSAGPFLSYAGMYALSCGGNNIFDAEGKCSIDTPAFMKVYEWFDSMLKADLMPKPADTQIETSMDKFLLGKVAMNIDGAWWLHDMTQVTDFEVGIAAVPVGNAESHGYSTSFTDCFFAVSTSKHPEADKKAIAALMSVEAIKAVSEHGVGGIPVHKDAVDSFKTVLTEHFDNVSATSFLAGANYTVHVPYSTYYNTVDQQINQKMSVWLNDGMTYEAFVKFMDETMKSEMD